MEQYQPRGWVKPKILDEQKGMTPRSLRKKIQDGKLIEGVHFKYYDGMYYYHFENIDALISGDENGLNPASRGKAA